jgi:hypothetical protein
MSNFAIYERYNEYSTNMIDADPKVRLRALTQMVQLYYQAPELKVSVLSKLETMTGDSDPTVSNYATRTLQQIESGKEVPPAYIPRRPGLQSEMQPTTGPSSTTTAQQQQKTKSIIMNVVCCIIFIIIYFVLTIYVF